MFRYIVFTLKNYTSETLSHVCLVSNERVFPKYRDILFFTFRGSKLVLSQVLVFKVEIVELKI